MLAETGPCLPAPLIHSSTGASVPTAAPRTCQAQLAQKFRHVLHSSKNKKPSALQNNSAHSLSFKSAELSLRPRPPPAPCGSKQNRRKKKIFFFFLRTFRGQLLANQQNASRIAVKNGQKRSTHSAAPTWPRSGYASTSQNGGAPSFRAFCESVRCHYAGSISNRLPPRFDSETWDTSPP